MDKVDKVEKKEKKPKAPWVEVYDDFSVIETPQGCLVKTEGMLCFMPSGHVGSFPVGQE